MADMVYNEVYFSETGEKVKQIMDAIKSEDSVVDFNKIIPIPKELQQNDELFIELSKKYPDVSIQYNYSYETMESSTIKNGEYI